MATKPLCDVDISRALAIEGWMSPEELQWLAQQALTHREIVEVGSYRGRSTRALADNTLGVVYALDDWGGPRDNTTAMKMWRAENATPPEETKREFMRNTADLSNVYPIDCDHVSPPTLTAPDMVFIDGSHEYADVKRDISYWLSRIQPGGLICGHDYNWDGVYEAVGELLPRAKSVLGTALWYWETGSLAKMDIDELAKRTGMRREGERVHNPPAQATELPPWVQSADPLPKNIAVAIGIPSSGRYVPLEWGLALGSLPVPPGCNRVFLPVKGVKRDIAREGIAEKAVEIGARNLLFIDDDNPPPPDTIYKLLQAMESTDEDVAVVAGIYCTKTNPPAPLVFQAEGSGPFWRWKQGDIFECERIATGCMMIRVSALAKLPKPWFVDVESPAQAKQLGLLDASSSATHYEMTDDIYFCRKVRAANLRILAHGGVLPGHWDEHGNVYFLPDDSYPMVPR